MTFGNDIVTFVAVTEGALDRLGIPAKIKTDVVVSGCRFRPLSVEETVTLTDLSTQMWKCTAPPVAAVLAAQPDDEVKHNGITYQIVGGVKPYPMHSGVIRKVTVMCKRQIA